MRDVVETEANMKLDGSNAIVHWMIRWDSMAMTRFVVGVDGMTAIEGRRGRRCRIPMAAFGELVWYKKAEKQKDRKRWTSDGKRVCGWGTPETPTRPR